MPKQLLMGNAAFAHAALEAGVNVVAGYPGTPSSELIETVAALHASGAAQGVHVEWSDNEKAALELLAGASMAGARTLFTCKQMGLNVASDALMSLNYVGIRGGMVLFVADDPGPISSQTEQDTRRFAAFAKVPVFDPASPEECCAMIKAAFEVSERYATPVIVRPTTRICHTSTFFDVAETTQARALPEGGFQKDSKWIIFPRRAYQAHGEINSRLARLAGDSSGDDAVLAAFNPVEEGGGEGAPQKGIVCSGISAAYTREALRMLCRAARAAGQNVPAYRLMQVGGAYPFPRQAALRFADGLRDIIVFEELDYVLEDEFARLAGCHHLPYDVHGKLTGEARDRGENSTEDILVRLAAYLQVDSSVLPTPTIKAVPDLPVRPPVLCAGCPHRGSFYAIKQALGKREAVLCGDIGCYTLGNAAPLNAVDTCLCMGAGITMAQGFAVADAGKKAVAFVGDSTFFASGLTGVANAVYNRHDITVAVLDNSTTAMTGAQPHPGTGQTLMGPKTDPIDIPAVLQALGVRCIVEADPFNFAESKAAAEQAIDFQGPSAIIFKAPCIQIVKPQPSLHISVDACTGCARCIKQIGCPAMALDADAGLVSIDAALCTGCGLCVAVCPFDAIVEGGADD